MDTVTRYWTHLLLSGLLLAFPSLFIAFFRSLKYGAIFICISLALIAAGLSGMFIRLNWAPGGQIVAPQDPSDPKIPGPAVRSLVHTLTQPWDSEERADWPVTDLMARLSKLAYQKPVDAEDSFAELGFQKTTPIRDTSLSGYVVTVDKIAVVIFRGTENRFDWFFNLNTLTDDTPNGPIHRGFHQGYQSMKPEIRQILAKARAERVWVTGHSLGGAMALACALDLTDDAHLRLEGLVTFGQPLVASEKLAAHIDRVLLGKYARLVNEQDIVTRVPATMKDCGSLVWFLDGKVYRSKRKQMSFGAIGGFETPENLEIELTPLTPREFEEMKRRLGEDNAPKGAAPDERGVAGAGPYFIDLHSMEYYIEKVNMFIFEFKNKLENQTGVKP